MKSGVVRLVWLFLPFLLCLLLAISWVLPAHSYITVPVTTLGHLCESTYITVVRVEKTSPEKGIILYRKVSDLKGKYPRDQIKHVFDLKNTPAHKGPGDVPIRPDAKDWRYAMQWAEPGKLAVMFTLKYDPYGDFGHTYIDGCWYATMCPRRDWEFWYAIYSSPSLLNRWHSGTPAQLVPAVAAVLSGKEAVVPVLADGTVDDLRTGKAKVRGLKVSATLKSYDPKRDLVTEMLDKSKVPWLIKSLHEANRAARASAARDLMLIGPEAKGAISALAEAVRNDDSATVRALTAEALAAIGPEAKSALPALKAALVDPRLAQRQEVLARIAEAYHQLK